MNFIEKEKRITNLTTKEVEALPEETKTYKAIGIL
jgi:hypothetical protein